MAPSRAARLRIVAVPPGSRVLVTETAPRVPVASLAASLAMVAA
jgi:hypothetical protein